MLLRQERLIIPVSTHATQVYTGYKANTCAKFHHKPRLHVSLSVLTFHVMTLKGTNLDYDRW
jgi:hypothetical protein